jgi:hypothetical protein
MRVQQMLDVYAQVTVTLTFLQTHHDAHSARTTDPTTMMVRDPVNVRTQSMFDIRRGTKITKESAHTAALMSECVLLHNARICIDDLGNSGTLKPKTSQQCMLAGPISITTYHKIGAAVEMRCGRLLLNA